jgi:hypothetical protein
MNGSQTSGNLRRHWPLLIVAAIGAVLIFTNLGAGYLWADEGDTAVLARNITKFGVPRAWDGTTFMDSDFGARVNRDLIMVSSPWLQYYVAAASFTLFGQTTFAARFPFALAGWLTIVVAYLLVWKAIGDRRAALGAALLTICSVQFLLFSRESRYYALAMLFTCLLIDSFLQMRSLGRTIGFGIVAVLLFHTHPIGIIPIVALGLLTLIDPGFSAQRRFYWPALLAILALTTPWFLLARTGYSENAALVESVRDFFVRLIQFLIECASVAPLIGIVLLFLCGLVAKRATQGQPRERALLVVILVVVLSYAVGMVITQRPAALWVTGVRYTSAIIPLLAIAASVLMLKISRAQTPIFLALLFLFAFTKFGQITPWTFWADKSPDPENKIVALHVPTNTIDAFLPREDLLFARDLFQKNVGTLGQCVEFLRQHASPGDLVITNYESEPLYFHTTLAQGMKIMKQDPIYDVARGDGLPEYVFGLDHARWIVWRFNWDDYLGIRWPEVAYHLTGEGGQISKVAEIKETGWENRENIHFHRFSNDVYLFPQDTALAAANIFRVDWPSP